MPYVGKKPADIIATAVDTTTGTFSGDIDASTVNATGDTAAGDNAAIGFTSAEGLILTGQGSTSDITVKNDADATVFTVPTGTDDILFPDNAEIKLGASGDLELFHNGTDSFIKNSTGNLIIGDTDGNVILQGKFGEDSLICKPDGAVELNHDNTKKFETSSSGVIVNNKLQGASGESLTIESQSGGAVIFNSNGANERFRVLSAGNVLFGTTNASPAEGTNTGTRIGSNGASQFSADGQPTFIINRVQDGTVVKFMSAGSEEGSISISGSTTSYNGGHISRYSRLLDNSKNTSIVKGTVMTNLNEMVEWSHEEVLWTDEDELPDGVSVGDVKKSAYIEDNEQLNKMAVSSVEGDANVAGVFVNWDNDDDFNDMNIAMTGDMVIRIAQGVTVARGDLLMSAGDGTAKTQSDDIVRSKTIAKVTSTNVSHTYDDGTYLVPCVLMAC